MSYYPEPDGDVRDISSIKVVLDLSNHATKKEITCNKSERLTH